MPAALDQLGEQHALVDRDRSRRCGAAQRACRRTSTSARIDDDAVEALPLEVLLKEQELALRRHVGPVDDRDARQRAAARTTARTRRAARAARRGARAADAGPSAHELAHDGQSEEHLGEHVVVRAARRRLGVVLGEPQSAGFGDEERVEARHRARVAKPGIDVRQLALPVRQAGTAPARRRRRAPRDAPCETRAARRRRAVWRKRYCCGERKRGRSTEQSGRSPKNRPRARSCVVELALRLAGQVVGEQRVVLVDAVAQHRLAPVTRAGRAGTRRRARRRAARRAFARRIADDRPCAVTAHSK